MVTDTGSSLSVEGKLFSECLEYNFYTQHVLTATRDSNVLGLVKNSDPELVSNVRVIPS